jgi:thiopeptide-type bacteriocin biosynthesis protein
VRTHEIVVSGVAGVPRRRVVPLDELVVGIESGRLSIEWPAAGVRVVGVQGHMLNSLNAPPPVRLLLDVATDGRRQFTPFSWGPANALAFLPRIQYGRLVLALAQWRMEGGRMSAHASGEAFAEGLASWRECWGVPDRVYLSSGDNRLLLDLSKSDQVELLRDEMRRLPDGQRVLLQEALPGPEDAWLPDGGHGRVCEIVVPLVRTPPHGRDAGDAPADGSMAAGTGAPVQAAPLVRGDARVGPRTDLRLKPPGSDWLYLKLYCRPWQQNDLIAGPLLTFGEFATASGLADTWFFIRFADPEHHLRIRFHGDRSALLGPLMDQTCRWADDLLQAERVTRFAFDTYERETERYGGEGGMRVAEAIFGADSTSVAELLEASHNKTLGLDRTNVAVSSVDDLLDSLGMTPDERLAFCRGLCEASPEGGRLYRQHGPRLRTALGRPDHPDTAAVGPLFVRRRAALAPAAALLAALERDGVLARSHVELCRSYVHMHLNRLLSLDGTDERQVLELLRRTREGLARAPLG